MKSPLEAGDCCAQNLGSFGGEKMENFFFEGNG